MSKKKNNEIGSYLISRLDELKPVPPRSSVRAAQTRARFLSQVAAVQPVRNRQASIITWRVFSQAMLVLLLLAISSGTVFAAQTSLPGQWVYPVKIFTEDIRLSWVTSLHKEVELLMHFTDIRVEEIISLTVEDESIPETVINRFIWQLDQTNDVIARMNDEQLIPLMARMEVQFQDYEKALAQAQLQSTQEPGTQIILRIRDQVQIQLALVKIGQFDPQQYRIIIENQQNLPNGLPTQTIILPSETPGIDKNKGGNPEKSDPQNTQQGSGGSNGTPEPEQTPKDSGGNDNAGSTDMPGNGGGDNSSGGKP